MRQTAVVVAPGRGTYNREELGYFGRHHPGKTELLRSFDRIRHARGQEPVSALDGASRFSGARHTRGDNASGLIYACAYADFLSIDQERFEVVAVTGNSMGWYIAMACGGALAPADGFTVVDTMGTLMHDHLIGGQIIYPFVDENWVPVPGLRSAITDKVADIDARPDHALGLSIDLGGMLVLAGNSEGLAAFEAEMPKRQDRYPMRLPGHSAFHTALQEPVAREGRAELGLDLFQTPALPLIDGRGKVWHPKADSREDLRAYTLGHQVTRTYDFTAAIRVAAREFMPDVFIVLGPGSTLGGATAQSLLACGWRGLQDKSGFKTLQEHAPALLSMGLPDQRTLVTAG